MSAIPKIVNEPEAQARISTSPSPHSALSAQSSALSSPDTLALHGSSPDSWCHALVTPLVQSTTYVQDQVGATGHAYSRVSNPTVDALERELGALENAPPAVAFSTGLAAETALFLTLLSQGDHAVVGSGIYGGTVRLFRQVLSKLGITATFVNTANLEEIAAAITPKTKLVFIETPTNPTLELADIPAIAQVIQAALQVGRASGPPSAASIKLIVDNTFLTPVIQRPLDLGADISVVSTTKHIEGHSTALGGAVTSRDTAFLDKLRFYRKATGAIQTPFQAWLTSRGIKTLPLRLRQHSENAMEVAQWLENHPRITRVNYPGLDSFPQRELALRQHRDTRGRILHGGVISFEVEGGVEAGRALLNNVRLCTLVEHVGSVETLLTHPATMTHADVPREQRLAAGITDGLIRISVGLEDPKDILADLERAIGIATALVSNGTVSNETISTGTGSNETGSKETGSAGTGSNRTAVQPSISSDSITANSDRPKASSSVAGGRRAATPPVPSPVSPTPKGSSSPVTAQPQNTTTQSNTEVAGV